MKMMSEVLITVLTFNFFSLFKLMNISKVIILIIIIVILYFVYLLSRTEKIETFLTQEQKHINTTRCNYLSTNVCEQNSHCQISNLNGISFCENKCEAAHHSFTKDQSECDKLEICNNAGNLLDMNPEFAKIKQKEILQNVITDLIMSSRDKTYCDPSSCQLVKSETSDSLDIKIVNYSDGRWNTQDDTNL